MHPFKSEADAEAQLARCRKDADGESAKVAEIKARLPALTKAAKCPWATLMSLVENGLLDQEAARAKEEVYSEGRWEALGKGWRRPWDGRNGSDFAKWQLKKDVGEEEEEEEAAAWDANGQKAEFRFSFLEPELRRAGIAQGAS